MENNFTKVVNQKIFVLHHEYERDEQDLLKYIGVFSTREKAEEIINKLQNQSGFKDWPENFQILETNLDQYHWEEGFGASNELLKLMGE